MTSNSTAEYKSVCLLVQAFIAHHSSSLVSQPCLCLEHAVLDLLVHNILQLLLTLYCCL
jgi:hypothetical protein